MSGRESEESCEAMGERRMSGVERELRVRTVVN
jgi:hypothetical protein